MNNVEKIYKLISSLSGIPQLVVEGSLIKYVIMDKNICAAEIQNDFLNEILLNADESIVDIFKDNNFPVDIESIVDFFEAMLAKDNIVENGIIFTPMYISDFIVKNVIDSIDDDSYSFSDAKIIDPGCGTGIFIISTLKYLKEKYQVNYNNVLLNNIYGIDIDENNVRRCKEAVLIYLLLKEGELSNIIPNIIQGDSLKLDWESEFNVEGFDAIIGNPPYVNIHDMLPDTIKFLKRTFTTTTSGVFNIFYAFIEHGLSFLSKKGIMSYIIPNNFLTIKSAYELRNLLQKGNYIDSIIDFGDNMVFKPVRTYSSIVTLSNSANMDVYYHVMQKTDDIENSLIESKFDSFPRTKFHPNGWHLIDNKTHRNIEKIESQFFTIKPYIRTGIATLRDNVYIVDEDVSGCFKSLNGIRYEIESGIVKRLYKIPELKNVQVAEDASRKIIFPYSKGNDGFQLMSEEYLSLTYPKAYRYLLEQKNELLSRDKGNCKIPVWFAFGRSQGLNKYGNKLMFPTFSNTPKFTLIEDEYALFCNGYAVFENDQIELRVLQRILNSIIMKYYITNTSYSIEGGYYCYQKKYIEKFSFPIFNQSEIEFILRSSNEDLDKFLIDKYEIVL